VAKHPAIDKDLEQVLAGINKTFGPGSIMRLGDEGAREALQIKLVSTGSVLIDRALGGGIPYGRSIEIYGPAMSGKTTLAIHILAQVQREGKLGAFIDVEHTFPLDLADQYGVDIENLFVCQPESGEEALDIAEALMRTGKFGCVIIDSVSALLPTAEAEAEMSNQAMGLQSRLMSKACRKLTPVAGKNDCIIIFINQIREKIGIMYGNPETTSGGRALEFYSSVRMHVRGGERIQDKKKNAIGHHMVIRVTKNKIAPPYRVTEVPLIYGVGFDRLYEIAQVAIDESVVHKAGAWLSYEPDNKDLLAEGKDKCQWQGQEAFKEDLRSIPELYEEIREKVYDIILKRKDDEKVEEEEIEV